MLFASLENDGNIEIKHWSRAQTITEHMRASLHRLVSHVNDPPPSKASRIEKKVLEAIKTLLGKCEKTTARNIARYAHLSTSEAISVLEPLLVSGTVIQRADGKAQTYLLTAVSSDAAG